MSTQPASSPSMPSVMFVAFAVPAITSHPNAMKMSVPTTVPPRGISMSLRNGG